MPKEYPLPKVTHLIANLQRPHQKALTPWKRLSHSKKICSPSEEGKRQALERWNWIKLCNSQNSNQQLSPEDWHQTHQCSQERGRTQSRGKRMRSQTSHDVKKGKTAAITRVENWINLCQLIFNKSESKDSLFSLIATSTESE